MKPPPTWKLGFLEISRNDFGFAERFRDACLANPLAADLRVDTSTLDTVVLKT